MHLDGGLVPPKSRPREQRKTKVDGGGVERIERVVEVHTDRIVHIQGPRDADKHLGEIGEDPPIMSLVGVGQIAARDLAAKSHVRGRDIILR